MSNYYSENTPQPIHPPGNDATRVVLIVLACLAAVFFLMCAGVFALGFVGYQAAQSEMEKSRQEIRRQLAKADPMTSAQAQEYQAALGAGDYETVLQVMDEALEADPASAHWHNNKAWLLATCLDDDVRNGVLALEHAERACELTAYQSSMMVDTLAAAYAELEDFEEAVRWQQKAIELIPVGEADPQGYEERLSKYRAGRPHREAF